MTCIDAVAVVVVVDSSNDCGGGGGGGTKNDSCAFTAFECSALGNDDTSST